MSEVKWDLARLTTGDRCALRRAAGSLDMDVGAWRAFYLASNGCRKSAEDMWFAAMCMECLWRGAQWREEDHSEALPIEECLRRCLTGEEGATESMERRVDALLETPWGEDGFLLGKLMNIVRILKDKIGVRPDFQALADDLVRWNRDDRAVQRRWLRTIYAVRSASKDEEGGNQK